MENKVDKTLDWISHYTDSAEVSRRSAALVNKLNFFKFFENNKQAKILDLCCGNLETLDILKLNGFSNICGLDQTLFNESSLHKVYVNDATKLPFPDNSFDIVLNIHALHHLGDIDDVAMVFSEVNRVLKDGGKFYLLDFQPSMKLFFAMILFKYNILFQTRYLRHYGKQMRSEWSIITRFLKNQPLFLDFLRAYFKVDFIRYDYWHFYFVGAKK